MNTAIAKVRGIKLHWPAVLLFAALLAQSPHAGLVFLRNGEHAAGLEYWLAGIGAVVYAVALEGATAFFVWKRKTKLAAAFAVFSVLHNFAYYLPGAWQFSAWGAELAVRNVMGALLISLSLPIAIAAFSHTAHEDGAANTANANAANATATNAAQTAALVAATAIALQPSAVEPVQIAVQDPAPAEPLQEDAQEPAKVAKRSAAKMSKEQRRLHIAESGVQDVAEIMMVYGVKERTAYDDIAAVRSGLVQANGNGVH